MRSSILKSGAFDALAHRIHPFCIYMFVPFVGFLEVDSCEFFGIRPAFFSAVDNIHSIWPLALRNSSAAHRSMASYISASTRKAKFFFIFCLMFRGEMYDLGLET